MVTINLLPWREAKRIYQFYQLKKLLIIISSVSILMIVSIHLLLLQQQALLQARIDALREQTHQLARLQPMLQDTLSGSAREALLQQLMNHQQAVLLFKAIREQASEAICLTAITRQGEGFTFSGTAQSMTDLKIFLLKWDAAKLFTEIRIEQLEQQINRKINFRLRAIAANAL